MTPETCLRGENEILNSKIFDVLLFRHLGWFIFVWAIFLFNFHRM